MPSNLLLLRRIWTSGKTGFLLLWSWRVSKHSDSPKLWEVERLLRWNTNHLSQMESWEASAEEVPKHQAPGALLISSDFPQGVTTHHRVGGKWKAPLSRVPCWARAYKDGAKGGSPAKKWAPYSGKKAKFLNWQDIEWKLYLLLVDRNCREKQSRSYFRSSLKR